eukprot:753419-Hanusia_phi.AAC.3
MEESESAVPQGDGEEEQGVDHEQFRIMQPAGDSSSRQLDLAHDSALSREDLGLRMYEDAQPVMQSEDEASEAAAQPQLNHGPKFFLDEDFRKEIEQIQSKSTLPPLQFSSRNPEHDTRRLERKENGSASMDGHMLSSGHDSIDSRFRNSRPPPAPSSTPNYYSTPDRLGSNGLKFADSMQNPLSGSVGMRSEKKMQHCKRASNVNQAIRREWGAQVMLMLRAKIPNLLMPSPDYHGPEDGSG